MIIRSCRSFIPFFGVMESLRAVTSRAVTSGSQREFNAGLFEPVINARVALGDARVKAAIEYTLIG